MTQPSLPPEKKQVLTSMITHAATPQVINVIMEMARARRHAYVCLSNVHMVVEAWRDETFHTILSSAALAVPDGKPVAIAMNLLHGTQQKRVAGPDLMLSLCAQAQAEGLSVYFYGSTDTVLEALVRKLKADYPNLLIAGMASPPFCPQPAPAQIEADAALIRESGANLVFIGLGCPKQERWMAHATRHIPAVQLGVGAAFPFYTGHLPRCPQWMQDYALEWLFRLIAEPKRLFKRYVVTNSLFLMLFAGQYVRKKMKRFS